MKITQHLKSFCQGFMLGLCNGTLKHTTLEQLCTVLAGTLSLMTSVSTRELSTAARGNSEYSCPDLGL